MTRKGFEPWIAVKVGVRKNRKLAGLPDDTARYGWIAGVLAEAKLQRPGGRFDSRGQLEEAIGRFAMYVDNYLEAGLLEVAGRLCSSCRKVWKALPVGIYVVHDWRAHQRDPFSADRAEAWREGLANEHGNGDRTTDERTANDSRTTDERETNESDSPNERPMNTVDSPNVTADSRARGKTQDSRQETKRTESDSSDGVYPAPDAAEPLLSAKQLQAWQPYRRQEWAPFREAWLARGFRLPPVGDPDDPRSQAHVIWEILDNRPADLVRWVTDAPGKTSHHVVAYLIDRWQAIKAEAGVEDDSRPTVEDDPTSTPESAAAILGRLGAQVAARPAWAATTASEDEADDAAVKVAS